MVVTALQVSTGRRQPDMSHGASSSSSFPSSSSGVPTARHSAPDELLLRPPQAGRDSVSPALSTRESLFGFDNDPFLDPTEQQTHLDGSTALAASLTNVSSSFAVPDAASGTSSRPLTPREQRLRRLNSITSKMSSIEASMSSEDWERLMHLAAQGAMHYQAEEDFLFTPLVKRTRSAPTSSLAERYERLRSCTLPDVFSQRDEEQGGSGGKSRRGSAANTGAEATGAVVPASAAAAAATSPASQPLSSSVDGAAAPASHPRTLDMCEGIVADAAVFAAAASLDPMLGPKAATLPAARRSSGGLAGMATAAAAATAAAGSSSAAAGNGHSHCIVPSTTSSPRGSAGRVGNEVLTASSVSVSVHEDDGVVPDRSRTSAGSAGSMPMDTSSGCFSSVPSSPRDLGRPSAPSAAAHLPSTAAATTTAAHLSVPASSRPLSASASSSGSSIVLPMSTSQSAAASTSSSSSSSSSSHKKNKNKVSPAPPPPEGSRLSKKRGSDPTLPEVKLLKKKKKAAFFRRGDRATAAPSDDERPPGEGGGSEEHMHNERARAKQGRRQPKVHRDSGGTSSHDGGDGDGEGEGEGEGDGDGEEMDGLQGRPRSWRQKVGDYMRNLLGRK